MTVGLGLALILSFQTPKGVCLIGATASRRRAASSWDIPDAKRRLPHWSNESGRAACQPYAEFQTPKCVCLIGAGCGERR